jgi:UPF0755 protein
MSRDGHERWDERRDGGTDGYDTQGGRRGRRGARADEDWLTDSEPSDPYPGQGSHRRSGEHPAYTDPGYADPGYADPGHADSGYRDRGYPGGDPGPGHGGAGYPDGDYAGSGYPSPGYGDDRYGNARYSDPGDAGAGYPGQPDGYGQSAGYERQSGGYDRPAGYPEGGYPHQDNSYPPGGYRDESYGASGPYQRPDGYDADSYGARAAYGQQDPYGGSAGYDPGDPYADPRGRRGANQAGHEGVAGAQYGRGYDAEPAYGRGADRGRYSRPDPVDDSGLTRRRQRDPEDDFDPDSARHNGFFRGFGAPDDAVGHRPPRKKKRRSGAGITAMLILIIFLGGIVGGGYYAYHWYSKRHADWTGSGYGSVMVTVRPGEIACSGAMENTLVSDGVVASASAFCNAAKANATGRVLEPGTFKLHKHMSAALAWALLLNPKSRMQKTVTVLDGIRASKVIAMLAAKTGIPLSQFQSALKDTSALGLPSWANGNPEGFLWPATYNLQPGASALSILQTAVKQATTEYASLNLAAKAKAVGFTEYHVIIEASLLEAEVPPQYYAKVARVIDNRLNQSPPWNLGLDSTVAYALNKYVYNLSASDLNVNSPYNTTKHPGWPPTPIDSPDVAAIQAVLHPAQGTWMYFVTVNKQGLTEFTSDPNQFQIWSNEAKKNGV